MKKILTILTLFLSITLYSQTVIEMAYIEDAEIILFEVDSIGEADVVIYKTNDKFEAKQWDCMWKFKNWGSSNFSIFIVKDFEDIVITDTDVTLTSVRGKVYFTTIKSERGYKNPNFRIDGVMKVNRNEKRKP